VRSALLRGREHLDLGAVDAIAEGRAAVAISMGGARKAYAHTDPNEDAAAFALGRAGALLAVADGHRGFEASEVLLEHLLHHPAPQWTEPGGVTAEAWTRHALAVLCDANAEILRERLHSEHGDARTTLALALVLPAQGLLLHAAVGDSHLFRVGREAVEDLAAPEGPEAFFLGHGPETPESLARKARIGVCRLEETRALVLATDGLSEKHVGVEDPSATVAEVTRAAREAAPDRRALEAARGVLEAALAAHRRNPSGDNAAVAVMWLEDAGEPEG